METIEALETRRSVRAYSAQMPPKDLIEKIAEAGSFAANGKGKQSPLIVIVTDKAVRDELSRLNAKVMGADFDPFYGAPCIAVVLANRACNRENCTYINDGTLVLGNMMNAAHALGLGSCWIHRAKQVFEMEEGRKFLADWGIEGEYEGIGHLALGYVKGSYPTAVPRKEDYIRFIE